jgi:Flp pilus assembly pilin Flp
MRSLIRKIRSLVVRENGTSSVEYVVMLMLIAGALITGTQLVGYATSDYWQANNQDLGAVLNKNP